MVQLEEVEDQYFQQVQQAKEEDDADYTDTESEISTDSEFDPTAETLSDRLYALRDMIPPATRGWVWARVTTGRRALGAAASFTGRSLWAVSVSALLIGVPFALCWAEEQNIVALEQEQRMRDVGGQLLTAENDPLAAGGVSTADKVGAALGAGGSPAARPAL